MAIEPKNHYWIYQIALTDNQLDELEGFVQSGRAEYVAGKLIGLLRANRKIVLPKTEATERKDTE